MQINPTFFNIAALTIALIVIMLSLLVLLQGKGGKDKYEWCAVLLLSAIWCICFVIIVNTKSRDTALFFRYIMDFSAICAIFFWYKFIMRTTNVKKTYFWINVSTISLLILNFSGIFVRDMRPVFEFNYYVQAGIGYYIFFLYSTVVYIYGTKHFIENLRHVSSTIIKKQNVIILIASFCGFIGIGSAFLLTFNIMLRPYLILLFALTPLLISYSIYRHEMFRIRMMLIETLAISFWLFVVIRAIVNWTETYTWLGIASVFIITCAVFIVVRNVQIQLRDREKLDDLKSRIDVRIWNNYLIEKERQRIAREQNHFRIFGFGRFRSLFSFLIRREYL